MLFGRVKKKALHCSGKHDVAKMLGGVEGVLILMVRARVAEGGYDFGILSALFWRYCLVHCRTYKLNSCKHSRCFLITDQVLCVSHFEMARNYD